MQRRSLAATAMCAVGIAGLWVPAVAAAAPAGGSSAADMVEWLRDQGYHVVLNGTSNGPLSQCIATGVHGLRGSNIDSRGRLRDQSSFTTVYVDISCNTTA